MGEGAGILILEELGHALRRGARIYAEVVGYGMTGDAYHVTAPAPDGDGADRASCGGPSRTPASRLRTSSTSTPTARRRRSTTRSRRLAIKAVFGDHARRLAISSTKSMTGHLLGAAGGIEAGITALALRHQIMPPTINYEFPDPDCDLDYVPNAARKAEIVHALSNSFGFGGTNGALVLKALRAAVSAARPGRRSGPRPIEERPMNILRFRQAGARHGIAHPHPARDPDDRRGRAELRHQPLRRVRRRGGPAPQGSQGRHGPRRLRGARRDARPSSASAWPWAPTRPLLVKDDTPETYDGLRTARIIARAVERRLAGADLLLFGRQSVGADNGQVPAMVAELLGLPRRPSSPSSRSRAPPATALREIEGGLEKVVLTLPAVVTAQKGLNEPRYETLKGIMAAKKKEIPVRHARGAGVRPDELVSAVEIVRARRAAGEAGGQDPQGRPGRDGPRAGAASPGRSQGHLRGEER